ncbi:MAG TPA: hypothetical protein VI757_01590 [Bacteroidia bacterium]|nr:hypothetical protein [Bacteroidia bacterium]
MNDFNIYQPVWNKYMPVISMKLRSAVKKNELQKLGMDRIDFENAASRKNAKYQFNLEMREGRAISHKNNSPIALDFARALNENNSINSLIKTGHFVFTMDSKFVLSILSN